MASTKKVSIGCNYLHLIFLTSYFLEFFASFVDCSLGLFNDLIMVKKNSKIAYFSKLLCSTVSLQIIKSCYISIKQV